MFVKTSLFTRKGVEVSGGNMEFSSFVLFAFKFFNTDVLKAASYLQVDQNEKNIFSTDLGTNSLIIDSVDYYQPELFSENRCS